MNTFKPYHCRHIDLSKSFEAYKPGEEQGYYFVLWWQEIPMGHLYLEPGEALTANEFEAKVISASAAGVQYYTNDTSKPETLSEIQRKLKQVFNHKENIPDVCNASLIICTRNRPRSLKKCLQSVMSLRCKPAEIIIVDNASADDQTLETVEQFKKAKYIREDHVGLDKARNTGAKAATQPIIIYTDDDTILHPLWIYNVCKTFDDVTVAAMTGLILAAELKSEAQWIFERYWPFNRGFVDRRYDKKFFASTLDKGPPVWNIGAGANMAFRKEIFAQVGYFDERLDVGAAGCNGDSELWYRILASGYAIHYNPRAIVWHYHRDAMYAFQRQIFYYMRGFTAAALIQHRQFRHKGNLKHLFLELPKYYSWLFIRGFPFYTGRHSTVFSEIKGIMSGIFFYLKNRNKPSNAMVK